jgi:nucleotide-binding universal stress UspA family protein
MYRSILVPLDGSSFGEQALPMAVEIARRAGATLQVAHVHTPLAPLFAEARPNVENTLDPRIRERMRGYLEGVAQRLKSVTTVPVTAVLLQGGIEETFREHAAASGVGLTVMATHGRGPLRRFWLGSVADRVLRQGPTPLLLVRPREEVPDLTKAPALKHVLIPLDGSELAERILEPAAALGSLMRADFNLLRVVPPVLYPGTELDAYPLLTGDQTWLEQQKAEALAYLDQVVPRLNERSLRVQARVVVEQQPATAILDEERGLGIDLIALGTHGRGGIARLLLGSVADKVIRGGSAAVLVVRAPGK